MPSLLTPQHTTTSAQQQANEAAAVGAALQAQYEKAVPVAGSFQAGVGYTKNNFVVLLMSSAKRVEPSVFVVGFCTQHSFQEIGGIRSEI